MSTQLHRARTSPAYVGEAARRFIALRRAAQEMLAELDSSRLEVVLIPSRDPDCAMRGGKIRAVQSQNAEWYRKFCDQHQSTRKRRSFKSDTKIKRAHTRRALLEILSGRCATPYAERIKDFVERRQKRRAA